MSRPSQWHHPIYFWTFVISEISWDIKRCPLKDTSTASHYYNLILMSLKGGYCTGFNSWWSVDSPHRYSFISEPVPVAENVRIGPGNVADTHHHHLHPHLLWVHHRHHLHHPTKKRITYTCVRNWFRQICKRCSLFHTLQVCAYFIALRHIVHQSDLVHDRSSRCASMKRTQKFLYIKYCVYSFIIHYIH